MSLAINTAWGLIGLFLFPLGVYAGSMFLISILMQFKHDLISENMYRKHVPWLQYSMYMAPVLGMMGTISGFEASMGPIGDLMVAKDPTIVGYILGSSGLGLAFSTTKVGLTIMFLAASALMLINHAHQRFLNDIERQREQKNVTELTDDERQLEIPLATIRNPTLN